MKSRLAFCWMMLLVLRGQLASADEELPSIETIRKSYLAATTSIFTLDCEMELKFQLVKPQPQKDPSQRFDSARAHLWRKGAQRALLYEYIDGNGEGAVANWYAFDGEIFSHWSKSLRPAESLDWLPSGSLQAEKQNHLYETFTADRLTGETLTAGDLPLGVLLADPQAKATGFKEISGSNCVEVHFPRHMAGRMFPDMKTVETIVWLDPKHSYLPRLIQYWTHYATPPDLYEFETTEFGRFVGEDQQTYPFPKAGESRNAMTITRLKVVKATFNGPLSSQEFKPDFPPLTEVLKDLPGRPKEWVVQGDPREREQAIFAIHTRKQRDAEAKKGPSVMTTPPSALPHDAGGWLSSGWFRFLACLTFAGVLVFGVRVWRTRN